MTRVRGGGIGVLMRRKRLCGLLGTALLLAPVLQAQGAGTQRFLEGCYASGDALQILCADVVGEESVEAGNFMITLSGEELPVQSAAAADEAGIPATFYCLVDVSGSMGEGQMAQAKEALLAIGRNLGEQDNMAVSTLGNQVSESGFLTGAEAVEEAVDALEAGNEDTNLYAGIVESLRLLDTDPNVHPRKYLLIFSDGEDDQQSGITQEEAVQAAEASSVPIYTVATLPEQPGDSQLEYGKLLGSFARMSAGGHHYTPAVEGISGEQAGEQIMADIQRDLLLSVQLPQQPAEKDILLLRVAYTAADGSSYEDTLEIYAEDVLAAGLETDGDAVDGEAAGGEAAGETSVDEEEVPGAGQEDAASGGEAESQPPVGLYIGIGAAILLLLLFVVIAVRRKGGKKQSMATGEPGNTAEGSNPNESAEVETGDVLEETEEIAEEELPESGQELPSRERYELYLTAVGYEHIVRTLVLEKDKEVTVGRDQRADRILDGEDRRLSGVHCKLRWDGEKLYVWDMGSTNGTFVNGVPISQLGMVALHEGETIRMGSYEYRIGREEEGGQ